MLNITNTIPTQSISTTNFKGTPDGRSIINNAINKLEKNIIVHEKDISNNGNLSEKLLKSIGESMNNLRNLAKNLKPNKITEIAQDFSGRINKSKDITTDYLTSGYMKNVLEANQINFVI